MDVAILSLEDEFPELSPVQVRAALEASGGSLPAARVALAAAAGASQQPVSPSRAWWPRSQFATASAAVAAAPSSRVARSGMQPGGRGRPDGGLGPSTHTSAPQLVPSSVAAAGSSGVGTRRVLSRSSGAVLQQPGPSSSSRSGPAISSSAAAVVAGSAGAAGKVTPPAGLQSYYAGVFLDDASRQRLLQHASPLHEAVTADHLTLRYRPSVEQCSQLPLGREAALFVVGVASDYRAQAVAVQPPSWLPLSPGAVPHVTVSVSEGTPAREAGNLVAAALADPAQLAVLPGLRLLHGQVGVQLTDGSRVFSQGELQQALAGAAGAPLAPKSTQAAAAAAAAPVVRILKRGQPPPAPAANAQAAAPPQQTAASVVPAIPSAAAPLVEPAVPRPAATAAVAAAGNGLGWDLDSLMNELHLEEQQSGPRAAGKVASSRSSSNATGTSRPSPSAGGMQQAQSQPQRRGLLKLPTPIAAAASSAPIPVRRAAPAAAAKAAGLVAAGSSSKGIDLAALMRSSLGTQPAATAAGDVAQPPQQQQHWEQVVEEPAVTALQEAEDAAEDGGPLDMVGTLAALLPQGSTAGLAGAAGGVGQMPPSSRQQEEAAVLGEATFDAGAAELAAAASVDPAQLQLLGLQFPLLDAPVLTAALKMHGGALPETAQFLFSLAGDPQGQAPEQQQQQQQQAAPASAGDLQHFPPLAGGEQQHQLLLPSLAPSNTAPPTPQASNSTAASRGGSAFWDGFGPEPLTAVAAGGQSPQAQQLQLQPSQQYGRKGAAQARKRGGTAAGGREYLPGHDPISVAERQAMSLHIKAKQMYNQAAREALQTGNLPRARELLGTAQQHEDAATASRRRANTSAFRTTNAEVQNVFKLDLHGQHVDEALSSLERYLLTLGGLGHPGGVLLQVITGRGRHSVGGQPRVLPAVVRYLSDAGYQFDTDQNNVGVVLVQLGQ